MTSKETPGDFDACWYEKGVDVQLLYDLEPVLFQSTNQRAAQKAKFGGEFFLASALADSGGRRFWEFFQQDKDGNKKGIIALNLRSVET